MDLLPYKSRLWKMLHTGSKPLIRKMVRHISRQYYREIEQKKLKEGWINPEIELLYSQMTEIMDQHEAAGVWARDRTDLNREMWTDLRRMVCCLLDEDSYYLLRWFYMVEVIRRDYDKYRIPHHKKRAYWWSEEKIKKMTHDEVIKYAVESKQTSNPADSKRRGNIPDSDRTS